MEAREKSVQACETSSIVSAKQGVEDAGVCAKSTFVCEKSGGDLVLIVLHGVPVKQLGNRLAVNRVRAHYTEGRGGR